MDSTFSLASYTYHLPENLIAQHPAESRDQSRLMVLHRDTGRTEHRQFRDFHTLLEPGDCLVMNNTRVFPARLHGRRETGGRVEFFLLHYPEQTSHPAITTPHGTGRARALTRSSKPLRPGQQVNIGQGLQIEVVKRHQDGSADILLHHDEPLEDVLEKYGETPLPPYIKRNSREPEDASRYQTVYARETGSVAAPTAGLHFTGPVLDTLKEKGVEVAEITLHVGYGTFAPVRSEDIREHRIHSEYVVVPESACEVINSTREKGGRVVAVGTTSVRSMEWAADSRGTIYPKTGECDLYIMPGYRFRAVDCMLTNFHLPCSSLLILVSAFAGRERILEAYRQAVDRAYRFYSYGDAMFIA